MNKDGLKVLKATIKNFKNIDYKVVDFNGRSVIIAGPNQAGKSSLIEAIASPVNANYIPSEPIKEGEESGSTEIVIGGMLNGEEVSYTVGCYFSQEHKRGRLILHDQDGSPIKGGERGILNDIIGDIGFDIMQFIKLGQTSTGKLSKDGVRQQIEILKRIMPKDTLVKLHELDSEKEEVYESRTELNRTIKFNKSQIANSGFTQEGIDKYSETLDVKELSAKISKARDANAIMTKSEDYIKQSYVDIPLIDSEVKALEFQIRDLEEKKLLLQRQAKKCTSYLSTHNAIDISELESQFETISEHNTKHLQVKELDKTVDTLKGQEITASEASDRLTAIDIEKKELFATAKMPVKGLTFDEEQVLYKDLPLSNASSSVLLGIGVRVSMALNPNLRLLIIKDGSLLDEKTMEFVLDLCEKKGYQLLIEVVESNDSGEVSIEFVEK